MEKKVRVRFAPSPTGPLHIGSARTALFNFVYARQSGGAFVLRFEDTDLERSQKIFEDNILAGLNWLGMTADETYHQSERGNIYRSYMQKLTDNGLTYEHDGGIYFKLPEGSQKVIVDDLIRGKVEFDSKDFDDLVLFKKDGSPTFHFANVVDDIEMKITHVIRGEDHLSNTPKHIMLYRALDATPPQFAHIPLILNQDRSKMSKRTGDVNLDDYKQAGYLPEALINFLIQLGWSDPENREFITLDEIIKSFDLNRVQKGGAVFEVKQLNHINHHYLMQKPLDEYIGLAEPYIGVIARSPEFNRGATPARTDEPARSRYSVSGGRSDSGGKQSSSDKESDSGEKQSFPVIPALHSVIPAKAGIQTEKPTNISDRLLRSALHLVQDRAQTLSEIPELIGFFFVQPEYDASLLVFKKSSPEQTAKGLNVAVKVLEAINEPSWIQTKLQQILDESLIAEELQPGDLFWPVRVALSGRNASPSPAELLDALGKTESLSRIKIAINKLGS